jgi:hypothetical protein
MSNSKIKFSAFEKTSTPKSAANACPTIRQSRPATGIYPEIATKDWGAGLKPTADILWQVELQKVSDYLESHNERI